MVRSFFETISTLLKCCKMMQTVKGKFSDAVQSGHARGQMVSLIPLWLKTYMKLRDNTVHKELPDSLWDTAKPILCINISLYTPMIRHLITYSVQRLEEITTWLLASWLFCSSSEDSCAAATLLDVLQPMMKWGPSASPCCKSKQ